MSKHVAILLFLALGHGLFTASLTQGLAMAGEPMACPAEGSGETSEDCPWGGIARALIAEAEAGRPVLPKFRELAPSLASQAAKDAERVTIKNLWGKSINFDEGAKATIVHPAILKAIGELFGEEAEGRIIHAGMEHTYGYLFSTLRTSFGYKRARWVKPIIAQGLEIPYEALDPMAPEAGSATFFGNTTYLFSNIAFRGDGPLLQSVRKAAKEIVHPALVSYPYSKLKMTRLEEAVEVRKPSPRQVVLRTDFVSFKTIPAGQSNSHLLVYSVLDPLHGGPRLITAFPVERSFVDRALKPDGLGANRPVISRYNAFVEGLTGEKLMGNRQVVSGSRSAPHPSAPHRIHGTR